MRDADDGAIEHAYALTARNAGLDMPPTRLIPSNVGAGHFAVKLFDRDGDGRRLHMHTAAGLLHQAIGLGYMDYADLIELSRQLTRDERDRERIYRLAVFNVLACNRDDHGKNFSFLMDRDGAWTLSPPYDLTFCPGMADSHATTVLGEGYSPSREALLALAEAANVPAHQAKQIMDQTRAALADFRATAQECGVSRDKIQEIAREMERTDRDVSDARGRDPAKKGHADLLLSIAPRDKRNNAVRRHLKRRAP